MGKKKRLELTEEVLSELLESLENVETTLWKGQISGKTERAKRLQKAQLFTLPHLNRAADCMNGMLETMRGER